MLVSGMYLTFFLCFTPEVVIYTISIVTKSFFGETHAEFRSVGATFLHNHKRRGFHQCFVLLLHKSQTKSREWLPLKGCWIRLLKLTSDSLE